MKKGHLVKNINFLILLFMTPFLSAAVSEDYKLLDHPRSKKDITHEDVGKIVQLLWPELYATIKDDTFDYIGGTVQTVDKNTVIISVPSGIDVRPFGDSEFIIYRKDKFIALAKAISINKYGLKAVLVEGAKEMVMPGDQVQNRL